jgi:hypothetical protein
MAISGEGDNGEIPELELKLSLMIPIVWGGEGQRSRQRIKTLG